MSESLIGPLKCDQTDKTYQKKIESWIFIIYKGHFTEEVLYELKDLSGEGRWESASFIVSKICPT